jgi:YD repeat-containing protein
MFKRSLAVVAVISLITILPGRLMPASFTTHADEKADKKSSCSTCPASSQDRQAELASKLGTLGQRTQISPFIPLKSSIFEGATVNLVSTATGRLSFAVNDLNVPGAVPLVFQRTYVSDRIADVGLGEGWSFVYNDQIKVAGNAAILTDSSGLGTSFRRDGQSQRFVAPVDNPGTHQQFEVSSADTIIERVAQMSRVYKKIGEAYRLSQITSSQVNITITHDRRGNITRIANNPGGTIILQWSDEKDARLLGVTDSSGGHVSFRQDGHRLRAAIDSANAHWDYDYADGKLKRATDPLGRTLLRVGYDREGRVIEAGDAVGAHRYNYNFTSGSVSRRTVVTDAMNAVTTYEHTERGALVSMSDDEGRSARIEYNAANRPVSISDSQGNESAFAYDSQNRLVRQTVNGNTERAYVYDAAGRVSSTGDEAERSDLTLDAQGNVIASRSGDSANAFTATYNGRSQLTSVSAADGRKISFEYDANGNETARTYSGIGRFEQGYDAAGRRVFERLPSGVVYNYEHDARGRIAKESDNRGRSVRAERDASGALVGLVAPDGKWVRATRDEAGRIVKLSASNGRSRQFAYDARGALTDYTNARGKRSKLTYDRRGRLQNIAESDGVSYKYNYDRNDRLVSVKRTSKAEGVLARFSHALQGEDYAPWCFGGSDWFMEGFNMNDSPTFGFGDMTDYGSDCSDDPFGGFDGWGDFGGGFDDGSGWYGGGWLGGPETCAQCIARNVEACRLAARACILNTGGVSLGVLAGCTLAGLAIPIAGLILCSGLVLSGNLMALVACANNRAACELQARNNCPQCNTP